MKHAIINAHVGDGHFWKHPESRNHCIIWTSICKDWLETKQRLLLHGSVESALAQVRKANAPGCFANAKPLYQLKTYSDKAFTDGCSWPLEEVFQQICPEDMAFWYLDDGCCVHRNDTKNSYRVTLCIGSTPPDLVLETARRLYGTNDIGRICKNNSRASERNLSWIVPKPVAVQILREARIIAPPSLRYKVPLW